MSVPFNANIKEYLYGVGSLERFAFMLASSVRLTEGLVHYLDSLGVERCVCAGISLGGWITNLHHCFYDSCSEYRPIFAGAAPDHLFTETVYRKLLAGGAETAGGAEVPETVDTPDTAVKIRGAINFEEEFAGRDNKNVFPCMARYDQYIRFERQAQIYRPENIRILDRGHTTGAASHGQLALHLFEGGRF